MPDYELAYDVIDDYESMSLEQFMEHIKTTIAPSCMAEFADTVNDKVNDAAEVCKQCPPDCPMRDRVREVFNKLGEYVLKSAILNAEAAMWLAVEMETGNRLYGR